MTPTYYVQSSEVAGLIGRHQYVQKEQAIIRFLNRFDKTNFNKILRQINVQRVSEIADKLLTENNDVRVLHDKAIEAKTNDQLQELNKQLFDEIEKTDYYKTKKEYIQHEIQGRVNKMRGSLYENKGINQYERKTNKVITHRNSETYEKIVKKTLEYNIILRAKVDGIDREHNCLIEHKNRVNRLFEEIPDYEQVQMEIYMRMTGLERCQLIQTHFKETSELDFNATEKGWKSIKKQLILTIDSIHNLLNNKDEMIRFISKYRKYI
jgi:hypothetical protein